MVGFLVLFGIATDDGVVRSTYLDQRFYELKPTGVSTIREAVVEAGCRRMRPCLNQGHHYAGAAVGAYLHLSRFRPDGSDGRPDLRQNDDRADQHVRVPVLYSLLREIKAAGDLSHP